MGTLNGKIAIVTGGGKGVGQAIAFALAEEGATIVAAGRTLENCETTATAVRERGGTALALRTDVSIAEDIDACVEQTVAAFGTVDILVNNAVAAPLGLLLSVTDKRFELGFKTGPLATLRFMRSCHPYLRDGGCVLNIGTGFPLQSNFESFGAYAAMKAAVHTLTRAAAVEWGHDGIRVNALLPIAASPGMTWWLDAEPELADRILSNVPLGRIGDCAEDIGPAAAFLCGPGARYITGVILPVDGGWAYAR